MKKSVTIILSFVAALGSFAEAHTNTKMHTTAVTMSLAAADELVRSGVIPAENVSFVSEQEFNLILSEQKSPSSATQTALVGEAIACAVVACVLIPALIATERVQRAHVPVVIPPQNQNRKK